MSATPQDVFMRSPYRATYPIFGAKTMLRPHEWDEATLEVYDDTITG
jgi:hypothetical protein